MPPGTGTSAGSTSAGQLRRGFGQNRSLLADLVAIDATTLTFLVISSLAAVLIARLRSIALTFAAAIVVGLLHDLLTPVVKLSNYRDMTPFVIAAIGLLVLSRHRVMVQSREGA